jgi:predicted RND superfamily exporter protein
MRAVTGNPQLAALVSEDFDPEAGTARAVVAVVLLDPGLTEPERTEAAELVRDALTAAGTPEGFTATVYSPGLFAVGMQDAARSEAPLLFGLALLTVLVVLALMYRTVFDVAVGGGGLVATVVWTFGFAALFGPAGLGLLGPLSQLALIVPVLLVGLGIDYSVHLTSRYREQRARGQSPERSASRALRTVGAALVLATLATAVGFVTIATAPLGLIADFGVIVAVGVVCAFLVMGLLVPSARVLYDRRRWGAAEAVRELRLGRLTRGPAALARRAPLAGPAAAAALVALSLTAAAGLPTEFDRNDFVPEGSDIERLLDHQAELFGAGITESTFVVVDADFTDPEVVEAVREAQDGLGGVDGVRSLDGTPQIASVVTLMDAVAGTLPGADPGSGPEPLYERMREVLGEEQMGRLLASDHATGLVQIRTVGGDAGAERLRDQITEAFSPVLDTGGAVTVTSEPIIIAEMSQDLVRFQARSIGTTLGAVLVLLVAYYAMVGRRPFLGLAALLPAVTSASLILGVMWLLGMGFNVLTATMTAIAIGIGVPYGVHVVNRFTEDLEGANPGEAVISTLRSTGGALLGSALTTLGAMVVLSFSGLAPIRALGLLGGAGIAFALLAALLVTPGVLVLWARRRARRAAAAQAAAR